MELSTPSTALWGAPQASPFDVKESVSMMQQETTPYGSVNVARTPVFRTKTEHELYVDQKAAEVAQVNLFSTFENLVQAF